jgi:alpha-D-ribose 1-methylphosphonate 5-triphosphate synthase subunit PhnH
VIAVGWDPVHDGREAFRACLRAMCQPGQPVRGLPRAGLSEEPLLDAASAVLLALLDVGVGLAVWGGEPARTVGGELTRLTGAAPAPVCDADFILIGGGEGGAAGEARRGSALRPEAGATLVYAGDWTSVGTVLQGPGIESPTLAQLNLPPGELTLLTTAASAPPAGLDALLVSPAGLTALPRSVVAASR